MSFWVFLYISEILALVGLLEPLTYPVNFFLELLLDIILVYAHLYILLPRFLLKRKFSLYIFWAIVSLVIVMIGDYYIYKDCMEPGYIVEDMIGIFLSTATLLATALGIKIFKHHYAQRIKITQLKEENLKSNLINLQKQVNPHFLFNTLNSLYVQAKKGSPKTAESIMQLSDLMRYQTYESQKESVFLKNEIEYLKNYLHVEKQRRENMKTSFMLEGDLSGIKIAPLIFLQPVENAVKYSQRSDNAPSYVSISFIAKDGKLFFRSSNSKSNERMDKNESSGFGLDNLKKRLTLLYPDHSMSINESIDTYNLEISFTIQRESVH